MILERRKLGNNSQNQNQDEVNASEMVTDAILTSDRNNIDWDLLKSDIELLNKTWGVVLLDLYELKVPNEDILDFSTKINECIVAIKNEDKQQSLNTLSNLYSSIPLFLKQIGEEENKQKIRQTQDYIIKAYIVADDMDNVEVRSNMQKALDTYSEVVTNIDYTKDKTYKTNMVYVLLNEMANSLNDKDSDVFYLKYKNLMEAINTI